MTEKVSDMMLMAFVDGELDPQTADDVRRAVAADAELAAREAEFRRSSELAVLAFADIRREPAPDRLVASIRGAARPAARDEGSVLAFRPRRPRAPFAQLALAASLVLALGAGYLAGQLTDPAATPGGTSLVGVGPLAEALGETPGGAVREIVLDGDPASLTTRATYPVEGGLCRSFELAKPDGGLLGVGCSRGGAWEIDLAMASGGGTSGYTPASGAALAAVDAYLDSLEAQASLPAGQ